jgi:hypothetical protein
VERCFAAIIAAADGENKRLAVGLLRRSLAKPRAAVLTQAPAWTTPNDRRGKPPMRMIAYLLAIVCVIAAVMYFMMPAGQLPTMMPGYLAGSDHIHKTHGIAAAGAAVVLFVIGWFVGRR